MLWGGDVRVSGATYTHTTRLLPCQMLATHLGLGLVELLLCGVDALAEHHGAVKDAAAVLGAQQLNISGQVVTLLNHLGQLLLQFCIN